MTGKGIVRFMLISELYLTTYKIFVIYSNYLQEYLYLKRKSCTTHLLCQALTFALLAQAYAGLGFKGVGEGRFS